MSVASSSLASPTTRNKALMVRLAPYLVEAVCELTRALKDKTHAQTEISGLLFGKSQDGTLTVEALKTFKDSSGPRSDLARRERMEKAFTAAMTLANEDPEFSTYKLLGWFSLRGGGGLINSDTEFHNRHFKNPDEVALIVWREGDTQITTEIYASVEGNKLTTEDYRWSSVRLSTELRHVSQPLDLVMRVRMNDDLYMKTYGTAAAADASERKDEWKKLADNAKRTILGFLPGRGHAEVVSGKEDLSKPAETASISRSLESRILFRAEPAPSTTPKPPLPPTRLETPAAAPAPPPPPPAPAAAAPPISLDRINRAPKPKPVMEEVSGLPMVIPKHKPEPKATTPWLSTALVFVLCSALTFGVMALRSSSNGGDSKLSQVMKVLFPGTDLELHAASHGESLELSWNRHNPVVANSAGAVLAITDGTKHFERKLDPDMVSNGVIAYKPISGHVTFQLKVTGLDQSVASGKLRVLDAGGPTVAETKPETQTALVTPPATNTPPSDPLPVRTEQPQTTSRKTEQVNLPPPTVPAPVSVTENHKPATEAPKPVTPVEQPQQKPAVQQPPVAQTPVQTAAQQTAPTPAPPKPAAPRQTGNASGSTPLTSNTSINGWDPNLPENKPAAAPAQQAQQAPPPDSKAVDFIGPKVLLQVMPNTRNLTPGSISELTRVEVEVRIDTSGRVSRAHLTNPNVKGALAQAATTAAKQWTFQPATLKGQRVESDHTIVFEFRPEGQ